jgi:hypothetical protein
MWFYNISFFVLDPGFFSWGYIICSLYIIDGGLCRTAAGKERKGEGRGGVDDDTAVVEVHIEKNSHLLYGIQDVYDFYYCVDRTTSY